MAITDLMVKTNMDSSADDPKDARTDLTTNVDTYNALAAQLKTIVTLNIGDGLTSSGGNVLIDLATNPGLEFSAGQIKAKVTTGIQLGANGIGLDINGLTEETSVDLNNDFVPLYDAGGALIKKAKPVNISAGGGLILLSTATASASSQVAFTSNIDTTYDEYWIHATDMQVSVSANFYAQVSTNGGSSWLSGSYHNHIINSNASGSRSTQTNISEAQFQFHPDGNPIESNAAPKNSLFLRLVQPSQTEHTQVMGQFYFNGDSDPINIANFADRHAGTTAVDAIRFYLSSGNITSGNFRLYGVVNS